MHYRVHFTSGQFNAPDNLLKGGLFNWTVDRESTNIVHEPDTASHHSDHYGQLIIITTFDI